MNEYEKSPVRKGDHLELVIESLAYGGRGVARVGELVVFVKNAIPGQRVKALVYRKKSHYAEARALKILEQTPDYVEPVCQHFPLCGGCKVQQLSYDQQVKQKHQQVEDIFRRQAGLTDFTVDNVIPAPETFHYRNKMEFTISNRRWLVAGQPEPVNPNFALGLHIPGRFDKILDIDSCHIQPEIGNRITAVVRETAIANGLKPYDPKTHIGFLRHLAVRFTHGGDQVMINIVTAWENPDSLAPVVTALTDAFPQIKSIVNNVNTRRGDTAFGEKEILLFGTPTITEQLNDLTFEISANSFFQTNTRQADNLYQAVLTGANLSGEEIVYDLFCGTGSITLFLARQAQEVFGFEIVPPAVEDATRNALTNGSTNAHFQVANLDSFFRRPDNYSNLSQPDVIVIDPPRIGIHEKLATSLPQIGAQRLVYVSCNPTTQARDTGYLINGGYHLAHLTMVDMFPHTPHIETVAVFQRN